MFVRVSRLRLGPFLQFAGTEDEVEHELDGKYDERDDEDEPPRFNRLLDKKKYIH